MVISTRGGAATASAAILEGLAPDGGLYAPSSFPHFSLEDIRALCGLPYAGRAARVLAGLLDGFAAEELREACEAAYGRGFPGGHPANLRTLNGNTHLLELFHGPTLAFKDVALQLLPHLLSLSARKHGFGGEICVLAATSGDTGKAALEGFCGVPGTRCVVFYPRDGVSQAQRLQMVTQAGENTHVIAVEGNFDDAQAGVKAMFADSAFLGILAAGGRLLTSANSINYGRLAPQVAYYFSAYADLLLRGAIQPGDPVHFAVPTGNFGNILAAVYARRMGLPIAKLFCAANANRVLADFLSSGVYDVHRPLYRTTSPSMDILVSSNLERYLFELSGRDAAQVRAWMDGLSRCGRYSLGAEVLARLRQEMEGGWAGDEDVSETIQRTFRETHVLIDPHTAVAMSVLNRYRQKTRDKTPAVIVSTASPFKFGHAVAKALDCAEADDFACCRVLERHTGQPVPQRIVALASLPVRHRAACAPADMQKCVRDVFEQAGAGVYKECPARQDISVKGGT